MVEPVGAGDPRLVAVHREVGEDPDSLRLQAARPDVPSHQGGMTSEVLLLEQPPARRQSHLAVTGDQHHRGLPCVVEHRHRLQQVGGGHPVVGEERHHVFDTGPVRRVVLDHRSGTIGADRWVVVRAPRRRLHVGRVPARRTGHEVVLSDRGGNHELVVHVAADRAGRRLDRHHVEAESLEDPEIGVEHRQIGGPHPVRVGVEGVGVGHDQLASTEQAEAGPRLVAELDLDLVHGDRQLAVGVDLRADRNGHHLLVGGSEHEGPAAGLDGHRGQRVVAEQRGAPALLPQLDRVQRRQEQLLTAGSVELLADHRLDPRQHPRPERQEGVDPRGETPDVAAAHQQSMARDLRVGRCLAKGPEQEARHPHGARSYRRPLRSPGGRDRDASSLDARGAYFFGGVSSSVDSSGPKRLRISSILASEALASPFSSRSASRSASASASAPVVRRGEPRGLDPLGHQSLRLGHQRVHHLVLGDDPHDLPLDEQVAPLPTRRDPEVGLTGLAGPVDHASHDRHLDRQLAVLERLLRGAGPPR